MKIESFPLHLLFPRTYSYEEDPSIPLPEIVIPKLSFALPIEIEDSKE
ncbi:MAG: hypothetical protein V4437_01365 [Patescibacteria group bacterium]